MLKLPIIGEIQTWPCKNINHERKLLPTRIQNWTRNFCALIVKCSQPTYAQYILLVTHWGTLWSVRTSISPALRSVASRALALDFGMADISFKRAVIQIASWGKQMLKRRDIEARIVHQMIRWNVNTIAEFSASEGAPSMRYKRNEFYIGRSAKWWRRKEK